MQIWFLEKTNARVIDYAPDFCVCWLFPLKTVIISAAFSPYESFIVLNVTHEWEWVSE